MAINPYFKSQRDEQNVIEDLTIEVIKIHGQDMVYMPRTLINEDKLFGEDTLSQFNQGYPIEMYISSIDGFEGEGDIISRFGLQIKDTVKLVVSRKRFEQEVTARDTAIAKPREGDLIYFPLSGVVFEITFTEDENPFYQLGKLYSYVLTCELHEFSHQDFNTGWTDIDKKDTDRDNPVTKYTLGGVVGDFLVGELVTGYTGITAEVVSWNPSTNILETIGGSLRYGGVTGSASLASGIVAITAGTSADTTKDLFASNTDIQTEGNNFINFTDRDPFSEGRF